MTITVRRLRAEHHPTGLGLSTDKPRLSWHLEHLDGRLTDIFQTKYTVQVQQGQSTVSFVVESDNNILVPWPAEPLVSRQQVQVRVKVSTTAKSSDSEHACPIETDWSCWLFLEAALLEQTDFTAKFISSPGYEPINEERNPLRFRKVFCLPDTFDPNKSTARLYVTAQGVYEAYINGRRVGNYVLAPGWQAYNHRLEYQTFDVASLLTPGTENVVSVELAEGWYSGLRAPKENFYGDTIGILAQLEIVGLPTIATDESWQVKPSALVTSSIYHGEKHDMTLENDGWLEATPRQGVDWKQACLLHRQSTPAQLVPSPSDPVRITEVISPCKIFKSPSGRNIVDFGQNIVGKIRIKALARPKGHVIRIRHAEVLEHGELGIRPLRGAKATDELVFGDDALCDWEPHFTFHGFRYIDIDGWSPEDESQPLTRDSVHALFIHTDMRRTGFFSCSDEDVNQLHSNIVRSMRGNFLSIPTDCPNRDERMGWTGDIQVFGPTASFLFDCGGMLANWMRDVVLEQKSCNGIVPCVVPNNFCPVVLPVEVQSAWSDVVVLLPWVLYQYFGDRQVLADAWDGIVAHLASIPRNPDSSDDTGLWDPARWQFGDWLDPTAPPDNPAQSQIDPTIVANAYLVHTTLLAARIAHTLGRPGPAARYGAAAARLKAAFLDQYTTRHGLVLSDSQTAYALALTMDLHATVAARTAMAARLLRITAQARFRIGTGFVGTPRVLHALSRSGHAQAAYQMLLQRASPGWLYPVSMGATTVWERWDSMLPDGRVNPGEMTSFNHYALGSVGDWLHSAVVGLSPSWFSDDVGWRAFRVAPTPGGTLTMAQASLAGPCGRIRLRWDFVEDDGPEAELVASADPQEPKLVRVLLTVPPNSRATVVPLDGSDEFTVGSGEYRWVWRWTPGQWPPKPLRLLHDIVEPSPLQQ